MSKGHSLQDPYLNVLRKERVPVSIYLVNGIKLQGQVESFDQFVVLLKNTVSQMVYKHAISTVVPSRAVRVPLLNEAGVVGRLARICDGDGDASSRETAGVFERGGQGFSVNAGGGHPMQDSIAGTKRDRRIL